MLRKVESMGKLPDGMGDEDLFSIVKDRVGLSVADLALEFESLGNDCELGFVQRKMGAEPLGLFRFSNPSPTVVLRAINNDFANFGDKAFVALDQQPRPEWIVIDPENGLRQHTFLHEGDLPEERIREQQLTRFRFLREKLCREIESASKIFVIKSGEGKLTRSDVEPIAQALRNKGSSWLLWVQPGNAVGEVHLMADGLVTAIIDRLTVQPNAHQFSLAGWMSVLSGAWLAIEKLRRE